MTFQVSLGARKLWGKAETTPLSISSPEMLIIGDYPSVLFPWHVTESQNGLGWKRPQRSSSSSPLAVGRVDYVKHWIVMPRAMSLLEHPVSPWTPPGRGHNLSGQPVPAPHHPLTTLGSHFAGALLTLGVPGEWSSAVHQKHDIYALAKTGSFQQLAIFLDWFLVS